VWVEDEDNEIDMQVKLKFLSVEVILDHLNRDKLVPSLEEFFF
jgi:hypothetical protein